MAEAKSRKEIYTIGHSNAPAETVLSLLREQRIDMLVDVRSLPASKHAPQFNRLAFARTLAAAGVRYLFMGAWLGGRPRDPRCYKDGVVPRGNANYLARVDYAKVATRPQYQQAVRDLVHIAQSRRTAIMCSEENPRHCHRLHLIAQTLTARGGAYILAGEGTRSLGTIHVAQMDEVQFNPLENGRRNYRLVFVDGENQRHRLPVTDLAFRTHLDYLRDQCGMPYAAIAQSLTRTFQQIPVMLRIGLTRGWERFPDRCYLQITGVYSSPDYLSGRCFADFAPPSATTSHREGFFARIARAFGGN